MAKSKISIFFWSAKQIFSAAPQELIFLISLLLFQGVIPAASLYAIQGIISWITTSSTFPLFLVSVWGGLLLADIVLSPVVSVLRLHLNEKVLSFCNLLLMKKANEIQSLEPFENQDFYDEIQFLKTESSRRPLNFVYVLTGFSKEFIALFSISFILSFIHWSIPIAMLISAIPHSISTLLFEKQSWDQMLFRSPESRKLAWISSITLDENVAKEIRLFGFGGYLTNLYKQLVQVMHKSLSKERWKQSMVSIFLSSLTVAGNLAIISLFLLQAKEGKLKLPTLVMSIQALIMTQSHLTACISYIGMTTPILLFFRKLQNFLIGELSKTSFIQGKKSPNFTHTIQFKNVSFSYPDGREALSKVNFTVKKGETIAIVGQNGAGKSTLMKLLLRFYEPSEGSIYVDGVNIKDLNLDEWRSSISSVFQDFGKYHFSVKDNITLGMQNSSEEDIHTAVKNSDFFISQQRLPQGIDTMLGKEFGGTSLSGGEWQKIAIARAFLRKAPIFVFDEPTSSLDPVSEQEIFKKVSSLASERTTFLITHRLGSVKMADRILVLKNGRLVEEGSHSILIQKKKEYSALFNLQANQYKLTPSSAYPEEQMFSSQ